MYDLFIDLGATEEQIEFPILYTNAKEGLANSEEGGDSKNLDPLFSAILQNIPGPIADDTITPQFLITNLDYDPYVGHLIMASLK